MGAPTHESSLEWFEQLCRQQGLALTVQRRTILSVLLDSDDHPTADQVYEIVRQRLPGLSRTTVYRVLDTFVRIGAVVRVSHPGAATRYDPKTHRHHHFVCLRCDRIIDLEDQRLDCIAMPDLSARGLDIQDFNIHLRGVCAECNATQPAGRPGSRVKKTRAGGKPAAEPEPRKKTPRRKPP